MLDLNLYRILIILTKTRNTTTAAKLLGISRSTVNRSLADLREHFNNELFTVQDGYYQPTQFTLELLQQVQPAILDLELASNKNQQFDLSEYSGELQIYAAQSISAPLTARLHQQLLDDKSNLNLTFHDWNPNTLQDLSADKVGIAVTSFPLEIGKNLIQRKIGTAPLLVVCRKSHPLSTLDRVELDQLAAYPMLRFSRSSHLVSPKIEQLYNLSDEHISCKLSVNSLTAMCQCTLEFDYIHITTTFFESYLPKGLVAIPLYLNNEAITSDYGLIYHRTWYQHPLLEYIESIFADVHKKIFKQ